MTRLTEEQLNAALLEFAAGRKTPLFGHLRIDIEGEPFPRALCFITGTASQLQELVQFEGWCSDCLAVLAAELGNETPCPDD